MKEDILFGINEVLEEIEGKLGVTYKTMTYHFMESIQLRWRVKLTPMLSSTGGKMIGSARKSNHSFVLAVKFLLLSGTPPYTWAFAGGALLPAGLGLNPGTGTISGTPLTVTTGTHLIRVIDADAREVEQVFSLTINSITESGSPAPPSELQSTSSGSSSILIGWTDNSSNEDYFEIERAPVSFISARMTSGPGRLLLKTLA